MYRFKRYSSIPQRTGLSLVEVVASTLIVGGMVVTALNTLGGAYKTRKLNTTRLVAPGIAHELVTEIMSMPYEDSEDGVSLFGYEADELGITRENFDDVDDYNMWSKNGIQAKDGTAIAGYENWKRACSVEWVDPSTLNTSLSDTGLKRITVVTTDPDGKVYRVVALRSKVGALEQSYETDIEVVSWIGAELRIDNGTTVTHHGAQLRNHAVDETGL